MHGQRRDILVEKANAPRRRHEIAGDSIEQRSLSGAVTANDRTPLAGGDFHTDTRKRHQCAEVPCHVVELERMSA